MSATHGCNQHRFEHTVLHRLLSHYRRADALARVALPVNHNLVLLECNASDVASLVNASRLELNRNRSRLLENTTDPLMPPLAEWNATNGTDGGNASVVTAMAVVLNTQGVPMRSFPAAVPELRVAFVFAADSIFLVDEAVARKGRPLAVASMGTVTNTTVSLGGATVTVIVSTADVDQKSLPVSVDLPFSVTIEGYLNQQRHDSGPCRSRANITFSCIITAQRPESQLALVATRTSEIATYTSAVLSYPTAAMSNAALAGIDGLQWCVFSHTEELDPSLSPTRAVLGTDEGRNYRGGASAGICLYIGLAILPLGVAHLLPYAHAGFAPDTFLEMIRHPSILLVPIGAFHQSIAACSTALLVHPQSKLDVAIGACGMLTVIVPTVYLLLAGTVWLDCRLEDRSPAARQSKTYVFALFLRCTVWRQRWSDAIVKPPADEEEETELDDILRAIDEDAVNAPSAEEPNAAAAQGEETSVSSNDGVADAVDGDEADANEPASGDTEALSKPPAARSSSHTPSEDEGGTTKPVASRCC